MDQHRTPPLGTPLLSPHGRTHARGLPAPDAGRPARPVRHLAPLTDQADGCRRRAVSLFLGRLEHGDWESRGFHARAREGAREGRGG